jgi:hypothetical protein
MAITRGRDLVNVCYQHGRLQTLIQAPKLASEFANVADELHAALSSLSSSSCADALASKQVDCVLAELARVPVPSTDAQQQQVSQFRKMCEVLRVTLKDQRGHIKSDSGRQEAMGDLKSAVAEILDGCAIA